MKKNISYLFICLLLLAGCKDIKNDLDSLLNEEKVRRIVVLVDYSLSIPASTINWYRETIVNDIIPLLKADDKLIVLPVDYAAQTSGIEIAFYNLKKDDFIFSQDPPNQRKELSERRIKKYLDTASVSFSDAFERVKTERVKYSKKTDLLGGVLQSFRYFDESSDNYIIILSDMKQDTEELNLETHLKLKPDPVKLIERIESVDLKKSNIYILTGDQPKIGINDYKWLKSFWKIYFEKNNGSLISYESGGISLLKENLK